MEFFYQEACRERDEIERRYSHVASQIAGTTDEAEARKSERRSLVERYNQLGKVLGLPAEDPEGAQRAG